MNRKNNAHFYQVAENVTTRWWFYLVLVLCVFIPPYTQRGFSSFADWVEVVKHVAEFLIQNKLSLVPYMPGFHLAVLTLFILIYALKNKFGRVFSIIAGFQYILITLMQGGARTSQYGLVIYPNTVLLFSLISACWFWEAFIRRTDYTFSGKSPAQYWFVGIVSLFSFWNPDEIGNLSPSFLLTSTSPIAFCMMTPIYLGTLSLLYPHVNIPQFRITSFLGILTAIIAIGMGFFMEDRLEGIYWSMMHTPLLITTVYCFILGFQDPNPQSQKSSIP